MKNVTDKSATKPTSMGMIIDLNFEKTQGEIENIRKDKNPFRSFYERYSNKRIELLNEIGDNWLEVKEIIDSDSLDEVMKLLSYIKLLSAYEEELDFTASVDIYTAELLTSDRETVSAKKYDKIVQKYEEAINKFKVENFVQKPVSNKKLLKTMLPVNSQK